MPASTITSLLVLLLLGSAAMLMLVVLWLPRSQRRRELDSALERYAMVGTRAAPRAQPLSASRLPASAPGLARLAQAGRTRWSALMEGIDPGATRVAVLAAALVFALALGAGTWLRLGLAVSGMAAGTAAAVTLWSAARFLRLRHQRVFIRDFPDAVDIIVRGVRAGLPVGECLRMVSRDAREPIKHLFGMIVQEQALGASLEEALRRFSLRMPLPEVRLFVTVLTMQARSGGGLSEALSNLSTVLRARRKLRLRIKAMSSEAKSSALIIGALPIILGLVLHFASPNYIGLMFTHGIGRAVLGVCAVWMLIGVLVMRRMIDLRI